MCWTCNINKLKAQIAKEDINVKKATKKYCISPFMDSIQKIYNLL